MQYNAHTMMVAVAMVLLPAVGAVLLVLYQRRRTRLHTEEKMRIEHRFEQELLLARIEAQEQSHRYFSEEIEDRINRALASAQMNLSLAADEEGTADVQKCIGHASDHIQEVFDELQSVGQRLGSQYLMQQGLQAALQQELGYLNGIKDVDFSLEIEGEQPERREEQEKRRELLVFRIIQESIANAIRHGLSQHIAIRLNYQDEGLEVRVQDDGRGFDGQLSEASRRGFGLQNMRRRALLLDSRLVIDSATGKGTLIHLIPNKHL